MGDAANSNPEHWGRVKADDWDIYPRPATDYQPCTVGVVLDPFVIYNYALDDGNPELSDEEYNKLKLAYTFATFCLATQDPGKPVQNRCSMITDSSKPV